MKKILLIIAIILLVGGASFFFFRKSNPPQQPTPTTTVSTTSSTPTIEQRPPGALKAISSNGVFDFWGTTEGDLSYITAEGAVFDIPNGEKETAGPVLKTSNISAISASPDGDVLIVTYGVSVSRRIGVFDLNKQAWLAFPTTATAAGWSPDGSEIAYLETAGTKKAIKIFTLATNKTRTVSPLQYDDMLISWPENNTLHLSTPPSRFSGSILLSVNIKKKTTEILATGAGLISSWLPNAEWGVILSSSGALQIVNASGTALTSLPFTTLPNKCAFQDEFTLYCAVPTGKGLGVEYPDNYLQRAVYTSDYITKIDLHSVSSPVATIISSISRDVIDVGQIKIIGNTLYLLNRYDQKIYSAPLEN